MNLAQNLDSVLLRNGSDRHLNEVLAVLAKHGYGKSDSQETPTVFAHRVDNAIRNCDNRFHKEVHEVLKKAGYIMPRPFPKTSLLLDLSGLPVPLRIEVNGARIPLMRPAAKKPNTGFHVQTHGRDIPEPYISRLKDELYEGKLHWIRSVRGYDDLFNVLALAYDQAARGKGKERHANDKPFNQQPLMQLADKFGTGFLLGQASKKLEECTVLPYGQDVKEILGAIVYSCAAVMHLELEAERNSRPDDFNGDM